MRRSRLFVLGLFAVLLVSRSPSAQASPHAMTVTYPPGWNLVGGPAGTTLSGATGTMYTLQYDDSSYRSIPVGTPLTGGLGYWAYFPSGGSATLPAGGPCVVAVPIRAGEWVMVGNPWPSGTTSVRSVDRVLKYEPASGYTSGTTLRPGQAAWANASVNTTVALVVEGCPTAATVPPSPPVAP
jgi:hypothetical protein